MRITEKQLRQIIRAEFIREGFMDKFKSFLGGSSAAASLGITEQDIADCASGRARQVESRTSPAKFTFRVLGGGAGVVFTNPHAVAADVEAAGMTEYFEPARSPMQLVSLRSSRDNPMGIHGKVSAASPDPKNVLSAMNDAITSAHDQAIAMLGSKLFSRLFSLNA